jgi:hypothetical protein
MTMRPMQELAYVAEERGLHLELEVPPYKGGRGKLSRIVIRKPRSGKTGRGEVVYSEPILKEDVEGAARNLVIRL